MTSAKKQKKRSFSKDSAAATKQPKPSASKSPGDLSTKKTKRQKPSAKDSTQKQRQEDTAWSLPTFVRTKPPQAFFDLHRMDFAIIKDHTKEWKPLLRPLYHHRNASPELTMLVREQCQDWLISKLCKQSPPEKAFFNDAVETCDNHDDADSAIYKNTPSARITLQFKYPGPCLHDYDKSDDATKCSQHYKIICVEWYDGSDSVSPRSVLVCARLNEPEPNVADSQREKFWFDPNLLPMIRCSPYNTTFNFASETQF